MSVGGRYWTRTSEPLPCQGSALPTELTAPPNRTTGSFEPEGTSLRNPKSLFRNIYGGDFGPVSATMSTKRPVRNLLFCMEASASFRAVFAVCSRFVNLEWFK